MTYDIQITEDTYSLLRRRSHEMEREPDELADEVLSTIVGYIRLSGSPECIAQSVLPHLMLAQIHDALSYYYDHRDRFCPHQTLPRRAYLERVAPGTGHIAWEDSDHLAYAAEQEMASPTASSRLSRGTLALACTWSRIRCIVLVAMMMKVDHHPKPRSTPPQ